MSTAVGLAAVSLALLSIPEFVTIDLEPAHVVGAGGALGAICRHGVYSRLEADGFPLATFVVNVLGSFLFGVVLFAGAGETTLEFVGVGFCGAFTTFSTFSVETVQLWEAGERRLAVVNALSNLLVSLAGIGLAWGLLAAV